MEHSPILPASAPVESSERFLPSNMGIKPLSAVARALSGFNRDQLGSAVEVLIALMDVADGEPDAENATDAEDDFALSPMAKHFATGPGCIVGDGGDISATEWHTRGRHKLDCGIHDKAGFDAEEDAEEDDAAEDDDGDTAIDDGPCDEPYQDLEPDFDDENRQMQGDVPMLAVFSAAYNVFTDKRVPLGISNLMTSFVTGKEIRSADSGNVHRGIDHGGKPGVPV